MANHLLMFGQLATIHILIATDYFIICQSSATKNPKNYMDSELSRHTYHGLTFRQPFLQYHHPWFETKSFAILKTTFQLILKKL